jgi:hypothetical protein
MDAIPPSPFLSFYTITPYYIGSKSFLVNFCTKKQPIVMQSRVTLLCSQRFGSPVFVKGNPLRLCNEYRELPAKGICDSLSYVDTRGSLPPFEETDVGRVDISFFSQSFLRELFRKAVPFY